MSNVAMEGAVGAGAHLQMELPTGHISIQLDAGSRRTDITDYIGFAARDNAKRGYLFVSKVLGKHYPVAPSRMRAVHDELAGLLDVADTESVVFVGMAETATGLGHGVFEAFKRNQPDVAALYVHSTRYWMDEKTLTFEEGHSHAPNLCLHLPQDPASMQQLRGCSVLVLVDDELSTGNTFVNLAQEYRSHFPQIERIHVLTLCDFSGGRARDVIQQGAALAQVDVSALFRGSHSFRASGAALASPQASAQPRCFRYPQLTGNFGRRPVSAALVIADVQGERIVREALQGKQSVRMVGTGEFMHAAFVLGGWLEQRGFDVRVQSTTRSPIMPGHGDIHSVVPLADHYQEGVPNFFYNDGLFRNDQTLVCCEGVANASTQALAAALNARIVEFRCEGGCVELSVL
ncbi:TPA: phosphoribosyltransferase domain-containing protein [Stenotrophomonas maltophilia]|uniref:phosphoribosyltransferase domain-containing protein n=1 Tax=Stenotrophomonas maltophilia group TaxID=995085 RepID=UPI0002C53DE4|nr:phosphoribosyltransferase domain-containing protein [Stenotrophomonas maltophilia]MBH1464653.1 phosphoribosyltransferase domain-containing protein [Stenotrophomonas maltophilia]MBH1612148.1 phosphoribosyltransferase domain-containing protein [Stenotrophomonas maltophilia]MBH1715880.1 phosphoribosyltransferase domain-containing protein [Stenotrophomonas maltophilia]MBN5167006.1 phosphoribosyltransferase domain-containing protein [Stenotrophomonas maltophilia]QGL74995.1 hypothetical protein F